MKWTVLLYANGNNEFEPEMDIMVQKIKELSIPTNINIVIQYSRVDRNLAQILRPQNNFPEPKIDWTGVQRIIISKKNQKPFATFQTIFLEKKNMADARNLHDFIQWGIESFPAERYMVAVGGHSFEYLGTLTDYSFDIPYIMGIPEISRALNLFNHKIDILVLDSCYMNMVEIMYELIQGKKCAVENVLTYIEYGPVSGLPMARFLEILDKNAEAKTVKILELIVEEFNLDLAVFSLEAKKLERIKRASGQIAQYILQSTDFSHIPLKEILEGNRTINPLSDYVKSLKKDLDSLGVIYKRVNNFTSPLLNIAQKKTNNPLARYYLNLAFNHNNKWHQLLGPLFKNYSAKKYNAALKPTVLPMQALVTLIATMNPQGDEAEISKIVQNLLEYNKWDKFSSYKLKV